MKPPAVFTGPTPTWRNDTYDDIDPRRPELSHEGQTVIITGAGSGIGRATAQSFVASGAKRLVLIGRTVSTLTETKTSLPDSVDSTVYPCDVLDIDAMRKIAGEVGTWDVFVHGAGYITTPTSVLDADLDDYWNCYEVNVKSLLIAAKEFIPTANKNFAAFVSFGTGGIVTPIPYITGLSAYMGSKLAQIKTMEFLAAQHTDISFLALHPGCVDTDMFRKSGATPDRVPMDTPQLPADFIVWVSRPSVKFLSGRFTWVNWDAKELEAMREEIEQKNLFVPSWAGWPYAYHE